MSNRQRWTQTDIQYLVKAYASRVRHKEMCTHLDRSAQSVNKALDRFQIRIKRSDTSKRDNAESQNITIKARPPKKMPAKVYRKRSVSLSDKHWVHIQAAIDWCLTQGFNVGFRSSLSVPYHFQGRAMTAGQFLFACNKEREFLKLPPLFVHGITEV